ncbi:uncharacterized protein LOC131328296 [Rhododendron vialii]|uniref:uncharacterized protein LOC131328296 n=1 Tax=Rhododendron vialii TaxID=182163 RepID=UPI00265F2CA4|nr:uncharacterized protein LOC131328296 [Rhododendron vialii]
MAESVAGVEKEMLNDIPEKFARNMKKKLPQNITVIGPSGAMWNNFCERESLYFLRKCGVCGHTKLDIGFQTKRNTGESPVEVGHDSSDWFNSKFHATKEGLVESYHLQNVSTRRPVMEEEKRNALKMALAASTPNSFRIVMRPSHIYINFFMAIYTDMLADMKNFNRRYFLKYDLD